MKALIISMVIILYSLIWQLGKQWGENTTAVVYNIVGIVIIVAGFIYLYLMGVKRRKANLQQKN